MEPAEEQREQRGRLGHFEPDPEAHGEPTAACGHMAVLLCVGGGSQAAGWAARPGAGELTGLARRPQHVWPA